MNLKLLWLKKNKIWLWTAVNKSNVGILAWVLGDRSAATFKSLWNIIKCWNSFFYATDGYAVYPIFINDSAALASLRASADHIERENSRLRHYENPTSSEKFLLF